MSAALRHAMETLRLDADEAMPGDRLVSCGIAGRDAQALHRELYEYFGDKGRPGDPLRLAMGSVQAAGQEGRDEDALALIDALAALPEGQRATLLAMVDLVCAHAAVEGVAVGALYIAYERNGRDERWRGRPKR
jgi:hypothetical protein